MRWAQRWDPGATRGEAYRRLLELLPSAKIRTLLHRDERTHWELAAGAVLVVDPTGMVITVLSPQEAPPRRRRRARRTG